MAYMTPPMQPRSDVHKLLLQFYKEYYEKKEEIISYKGKFEDDDDNEDSPREKIVQTIVEWFFENYTDPANNTPYESAEGGYQYIYGGPYDAGKR